MELSQLRTFRVVAETLNFTRAAEQCNVTQPALSRAIQQLEEEVGEAGEIDIATMAEAEGFPPRFDFETLYKERFVIGFSPGHRFAEKASIAIVDVDGETYLRRLELRISFRVQRSVPRRAYKARCRAGSLARCLFRLHFGQEAVAGGFDFRQYSAPI